MIIALVIAALVVVVLTNNDKGDKGAKGTTNGAVADVDGALPEGPKKGAVAPSFKLASLDGTASYEAGGKRDKVLIINFWAAWCGPCELEAPDLVDIYDKHKDNVEMYAVNATKYDKLREAKVFVKEQNFRMPVLTDADNVAGELYKVFSYPTSFIVNRDGVILERIEGVIDREQWEIYLQDAIQS
ncbi:TlpA family protein disulfide reductase [Cohnella sp. GCM10027633]|uniref:TlpA family protein disulfide reductase n=1 Tax=unclassified Cohnella TaxID=2636738 RepID=UPI00362E548E